MAHACFIAVELVCARVQHNTHSQLQALLMRKAAQIKSVRQPYSQPRWTALQTLRPALAALDQWSAAFTAKTGRPPTDHDKHSSRTYAKLVKEYRRLQKEEEQHKDARPWRQQQQHQQQRVGSNRERSRERRRGERGGSGERRGGGRRRSRDEQAPPSFPTMSSSSSSSSHHRHHRHSRRRRRPRRWPPRSPSSTR